jgi:hypothetical protein
MVHCLTGPFGESGAGATVRPHGIYRPQDQTARARAKELTWGEKAWQTTDN